MKRAVLIACVVAFPAVAMAHMGATGIVKERMDHMKSIKASMKVLGPIFKGTVPYDAETVRAEARALAAKGGRAMTDLFPEGSIEGPSEALPEIWQDWGRFAASARELEESAALLAQTAANPRDGSETDPIRAFSRVVGTCRDCHEDYRKD